MWKRRCAALLAVCFIAPFVCACQGGGGSSLAASSSLAPSFQNLSVSTSETEPEPEPRPAGPALHPLPLAGESNPLTGLPLVEGQTAGSRPVSVVVAGSARAMPQRGIADADVIYEMVTENGETQLMALYQSVEVMPQVGPVRATRDQFVQFAVPADSIHVHIGGTGYASNLLNVLGYQDIDGIYLGASAFYFDAQRLLPKVGGMLHENCWFTDAALLGAGVEAAGVAPQREGQRTLFRFARDNRPLTQDAVFIYAAYTDGITVGFSCDENDGIYYKTLGGVPHLEESGAQLAFHNVLLLFSDVSQKPDGFYSEQDLSFGEGLYFTRGGVMEVSWEKGDPTQPLRLRDEKGNEIEVQKGRSYIGLVPLALRDQVNYLSMEDILAAQQAAAEGTSDPATEGQPAAEQPGTLDAPVV